MVTKLYLPGDTIKGVGTVDTNHCGMPWPVSFTDYCYGTVVVHSQNGTVVCDALSGKVLTDQETKARFGNKAYDYEAKAEDCVGWRKANGVLEQLGMQKVWHTNGNMGLLGKIKLWLWIIKQPGVRSRSSRQELQHV